MYSYNCYSTIATSHSSLLRKLCMDSFLRHPPTFTWHTYWKSAMSTACSKLLSLQLSNLRNASATVNSQAHCMAQLTVSISRRHIRTAASWRFSYSESCRSAHLVVASYQRPRATWPCRKWCDASYLGRTATFEMRLESGPLTTRSSRQEVVDVVRVESDTCCPRPRMSDSCEFGSNRCRISPATVEIATSVDGPMSSPTVLNISGRSS